MLSVVTVEALPALFGLGEAISKDPAACLIHYLRESCLTVLFSFANPARAASLLDFASHYCIRAYATSLSFKFSTFAGGTASLIPH